MRSGQVRSEYSLSKKPTESIPAQARQICEKAVRMDFRMSVDWKEITPQLVRKKANTYYSQH